MASYCDPKCLVSLVVEVFTIIHKEHQLNSQNTQSSLIYTLLVVVKITCSNIVSFQLNNPYNK